MHGSVAERKMKVRRQALAQRDALAAGMHARCSSTIWARLDRLAAVRRAQVVFVYVSVGSEVATRGYIARLLATQRTVAVPRIDLQRRAIEAVVITDMHFEQLPGPYGIPAPAPGSGPVVPCAQIGCVLVPGLAFCPAGWRIGYGGGYYDRFLQQCDAPAIGLAFDMQVHRALPHDPAFDRPLQCLVTETRTLSCSPAGEIVD